LRERGKRQRAAQGAPSVTVGTAPQLRALRRPLPHAHPAGCRWGATSIHATSPTVLQGA